MPASPLPTDPHKSAGQKHGTLGKTKGATDGQANMNGNDFAKAIGINKPANVRDKIKRWQQEVEPDTGAGAEKAAGASATRGQGPAQEGASIEVAHRSPRGETVGEWGVSGSTRRG